MTVQRIPLPDWRDSLRGLPIAALTEQGIKPYPRTMTMEELLTRQSKLNVLRPAKDKLRPASPDRPGPNRRSEA